MTGQRLRQVQKAYRIGDPDGDYPIFDATGSGLYPGRWNDTASPMIYAAADHATAMLEKLVHGSGSLPPNQHYIGIILSVGLSYEVLNPAGLPGWEHSYATVSKAYGADWLRSGRSLLLFVPSVVARVAHNILINPDNPELSLIACRLHQPVWWDARLFPATPTP